MYRLVGRLRGYLVAGVDPSSDSGRAHERRRRALMTSLAAITSKAVSVGTQLISVPLTLHYLGNERFGLWMAMSSLIAMLAFADLGIGNGLLNAIAEAYGKDDVAQMRRYTSSALAMLSGVAALLLIIFCLLYPLIPWARFFNVDDPIAQAEVGPATAAFMICFALNVPATVVQRVQLGVQLGFLANVWQALGSLMALGAVLIVIRYNGGLEWLVLAFAGAPVLAAVINAMYFFSRLRPDLSPQFRVVTMSVAHKLLRSGLLFLVLQIVASAAYLSDNVVIARVLGAGSVTTYAIPEKMFSVIPIVLAMLLTPLWPAYGEAVARGDATWARRVFQKTLAVSFFVSASLSLILFSFANIILHAWARKDIDPPTALLLGLAIWKVVEALGIAVSIYLNGLNMIREQVLLSLVTGLVAISAKIYFVQRFGIAGSVWATICAYLICSAVPLYFLLLKSFRNSRATT
jgi:O-antigen/teichoic acid export membrane protein